MLFILLIFLICPVLAHDSDDEEWQFPGLRQILEQSRRDAEAAREQEAIAASLHDQQAAHFDDDDLDRALELSKGTPLEQAINKGKNASSEAAYFRDLERVNPDKDVLNFIGYMAFLEKTPASAAYDALFGRLDTRVWDEVLRKLNMSGRRAQTVVLLLDKVRNMLFDKKIAGFDKSRLETSINEAMLRVFSGCWGFSRKKVDSKVMNQLKEAAKKIGRGFADAKIDTSEFSRKIFGSFRKEGKWVGSQDSTIRTHFLALYGYVANGYYQRTSPDLKQHCKNELGRLALPNFEKIDRLNMFVLSDLITNTEDALQARKVAAKTTGTQVVFDQLTAPLKAKASPVEIKQLREYLGIFKLGEPKIGENEMSLKLFQTAFQGEDTQRDIEVLLERLKGEGSLSKDVKTAELAPLLLKAAQYDATLPKDKIYDGAISDAERANHGPADSIQTLNGSLYNWLMQYLRFIDDRNKIKGNLVWKVLYPGKISGDDLEAGTVLTEAQVQAFSDQSQAKAYDQQRKEGVALTAAQEREIRETLQRYPRFKLNDTIAGVAQEATRTGEVVHERYKVNDADPVRWLTNNSRAIDYLIKNKLLNRDLKLAVLLMWYNGGMLD